MRAVSLHRDVLVVTSALLQVNCVIVRGGVEQGAALAGAPPVAEAPVNGETFVIDSPVLPDELDSLPALLEQAGFAAPSGLLATHGDWDHLLAPMAFPGVALGCAESTAERLRDSPGEPQRALRAFDEELLIGRQRPLALGSVQPLPVPGYCAIADQEIELHPTQGHTSDGMAIVVPWARVLIVGDYLSPVELPTLDDAGDLASYLATLDRLQALIAVVDHVVPGHGPVLERDRALAALEGDRAYLTALGKLGQQAELPPGRKAAGDRRAHTQNVERLR
ncbi:MAG TPA: MBL fold metallo-hydrolase [Solirubrobacteraceae bacterium]|nr:MBL fold metallo-hydrolase [Solirubrobacteraceae bacterium]